MTASSSEQTILSIQELNHLTAEVLKELGIVWVEGEISNWMQPSSGHCYFTLKDQHAQVRCALFKMTRQRLQHTFTNGNKIVARARVSLYEPRGDYQLIIQDMQPAGLGDLQQQFEKLKKQLAEKGWFDPAHKQSLPFFPTQIGVITSPTGAAVRDILTVLARRCPAIPVLIYPTLVQGDQAANNIVNAIETACQQQQCDLLILSRGGGSLEDLWPFNEKIVAEAIFNSHIPIITGIGHEVDFTIADFVADLRAPTPSAAAEHATPVQSELLDTLNYYQQRLTQQLNNRLTYAQQHLAHLQKRLRHPKQILQEQMQRVDHLEQRLTMAMQTMINRTKQQLAGHGRHIEALNPLKTLDRGFAVVEKNQTIIKSVKQVNKEDIVNIKVADGQFNCKVV